MNTTFKIRGASWALPFLLIMTSHVLATKKCPRKHNLVKNYSRNKTSVYCGNHKAYSRITIWYWCEWCDWYTCNACYTEKMGSELTARENSPLAPSRASPFATSSGNTSNTGSRILSLDANDNNDDIEQVIKYGPGKTEEIARLQARIQNIKKQVKENFDTNRGIADAHKKKVDQIMAKLEQERVEKLGPRRKENLKLNEERKQLQKELDVLEKERGVQRKRCKPRGIKGGYCIDDADSSSSGILSLESQTGMNPNLTQRNKTKDNHDGAVADTE